MDFELTEDQRAFLARAEEFARQEVAPRATDIDETGIYPRELIQAAARLGLLGAAVPREWGGAGLDYVSYVLAIEAIARASATVGAALVVTNSLVADLLARAGTDGQKDEWLKPLTRGEAIGAFALSEPEAGTDIANQLTTASKTASGYRITGRKVWVANASVASVAIIFAATRPERREQGITAFLVPLQSPGVQQVARTESLGVRGLGCADLQVDLEVGDGQVLGEVGHGLALAEWALQGGRIAGAAQALGIGSAALAEALNFAEQRRTFGRPIADYQSIQWMLAETATDLDAARMLTLRAAAARSVDRQTPSEASMAKLAASEAAQKATDHAMRILASAGYRRGSTVERLGRDARATAIDQGTPEALRLIIAARVLAD
jgi:alkylation response protein AidB-like acyl-CoA dehydrogenase